MSGSNRRKAQAAARHLCAACRERRARFRYRGEVRADRQHVLCFQCFRAERERLRAWGIREGLGRGGPELPRKTTGRPAELPRALTGPQVEHRRQMLANLEGLAASR